MKSIIITGASGNLGQAVVERLLADGYRIYAALGRNDKAPFSAENSRPEQLETKALDLTDEATTEQYVREIVAKDPAVEAAICIVGGWQAGTIGETNGELLDKMIRLNFSTAYNIVRPLLAFFERQERGQFVFIGARTALKPADGQKQVAYALSKSLLFRLAEIVNEQGKSKNIRASVIAPSTLDTPQNRAAMPDADAGKWVSPAAAADTIAFLLGETGENLRETVVKLYNRA